MTPYAPSLNSKLLNGYIEDYYRDYDGRNQSLGKIRELNLASVMLRHVECILVPRRIIS